MLFFKPKKKLAKCGHMTKKKDDVNAFGESGTITISSFDKGQPEYCHRCLEKMVIRCAWCGNPIFIGDPVTLYSPKKDYKLPDYAVFYNEKKKQVVGCLGWDCAETGGDRAGFWIPPGKVHRVKTAFETLIQNPDAKAIISSDISKPDDLTVIK